MLTFVDHNGCNQSLNVSFEVLERGSNGYPTKVQCNGCYEYFNGKIPMIKHLREQWSLTLKEAKDAYESLDPLPMPTVENLLEEVRRLREERDDLSARVEDLARELKWAQGDLTIAQKSLKGFGDLARIYRAAKENNLPASQEESLSRLIEDLSWYC